MPQQRMTVDQFAASVKAKYPEYAGMDNLALTRQILEKHPQYQDVLESPPAPPSGFDAVAQRVDQASPGFLDRLRQANAGYQGARTAGQDFVANLLAGAGKGVMDTGLGVSKLLGAVPQETTLSDIALPFTGGERAIGAPEGVAQNIGYGAERVGEYFAPGRQLGAGAQFVRNLLSNAPRAGAVAATGARAGLEGLSAAGVHAAQTGSTEDASTAGLTAAGVTGGLAALGLPARMLGERIEDALVKASSADTKAGFKIQNIFKYQLGGTLDQSFKKANTKLDELSGQLRDALTANPSAQVDLLNVLTAVEADLAKNSARNFGSNAQIRTQIDRFLQELNTLGLPPGTTSVDLAMANQVKQTVGDIGAWAYDPTGRLMVADAKAVETVANSFYSHLKRAIEANASGPVGEINKQIGEVLAVRNAIVRRIPVADRANVIRIGDLAGMASGNLGISILNRMLGSGVGAQAVHAAGRGAAAAAPATGRVGASGVTMMRSGDQ